MKRKRILKWTVVGLLLALFSWVQFAYWTSTNDCGHKTAAPTHPMKAIRYCEYGAPDNVLKLELVEKPVPNDDQILVRVHAVSLRFYDGAMIRGGIGRLLFGLRKPKNTCPASDFAGTVETVGRNVSEFKPGDEVFGVRAGALSEYICVRQAGALAAKPSNVSFEQAATIPTALVSLQGLRDTGRVRAGQKVLINGASGGVGTFAVQIAKSYGAQVTGVCSTRNLDLVRSMGADHVVDYTKEDFTKGGEHYDVIYDLVNNHSFSERRRVLKPGGICVLAGVGGSGVRKESFSNLLSSFTAAMRSKFTNEKFVSFGVDINKGDLGVLRDLTEGGKVTPPLTKVYPLAETAAAYNYLETGHVQGKIAITVE